MDRRKFLESVCAAGAGIAVAGSFIDLAILPKTIARTGSRTEDVHEIPINLIDTPELKPVGGTYHLELPDSGQDILVVHATQDKFVGVDLKCKHRGCDISYDGANKKYVCPCHGSEYDLYGRILKGPTQQPLNYYHAELRGDEVMVTVYGPGDAIPANSIPPAPDTAHGGMTLDSSRVNSFPSDSIHRSPSDSTIK